MHQLQMALECPIMGTCIVLFCRSSLRFFLRSLGMLLENRGEISEFSRFEQKASNLPIAMRHTKHFTCFNRLNYIFYVHRPQTHVLMLPFFFLWIINVAICLLFCVGHYGCITARLYRHSVWSATYWPFHAYASSCTVISTFRALSGHTNNIW